MYLFDIVSLFTNIPLDETISICAITLYYTDITPPENSEDAFPKLLFAASLAKGVEFGFGVTMSKQIRHGNGFTIRP